MAQHPTYSAFLTPSLDEAIGGQPWHGPSIDALLADVTAAEASARPIPGAHTIAELAAHLFFWAGVAARRLAGERGSPGEAEQWAPLDTSSNTAWKAAVASAREQHASFARAVADLSDERLAAPVGRRRHSTATMLHGIAEHYAYHGGQIALLKRAIRSR